MRRARWIAPWKDSETKPAIYHCISRVVERRFAFELEEKERFRTLMRMMENFTGCRVLSYCLMCNHIHILLEVPAMPEEGFPTESRSNGWLRSTAKHFCQMWRRNSMRRELRMTVRGV